MSFSPHAPLFDEDVVYEAPTESDDFATYGRLLIRLSGCPRDEDAAEHVHRLGLKLERTIHAHDGYLRLMRAFQTNERSEFPEWSSSYGYERYGRGVFLQIHMGRIHRGSERYTKLLAEVSDLEHELMSDEQNSAYACG